MLKLIIGNFPFEVPPVTNLTEILETFASAQTNEKRFKQTIGVIKNYRGQLSQIAAKYYQTKGYTLLSNDIPLLIKDTWTVNSPIPINDIKLSFRKENKNNYCYTTGHLPLNDTYVSNIINLLYQGDKAGSPYRDNLCYVLQDYQDDKTFTFSLCQYFDYINTCEYIMYDFVYNLLAQNVNKAPSDQTGLTIDFNRDYDPFNFHNRYAVAGICTLIIFLDKEQPLMYIHKRSKKAHDLAEAINVMHVIPAGTFQPIHETDSFHQQDFNFFTNIMREFGEELYSDKENLYPAGKQEDIFKRKSILQNVHLIKNGLCKVFYVGFGVDCLNLKPEILTILVYNKQGFVSLFGGLNFEPNNEGKPFAVPFNKETLLQYSSDIEMFPSGAACMYKAYEHYNEISVCLSSLG